MPITASSPPARPTLRTFDPAEVSFSPGRVVVDIDIKNGTVVLQRRSVTITPGQIIGLRYVAATGELENFTITDGTVTVDAAFTAFVGAAGAFQAKADALCTWIQGKGGLPA